MQHNINDQVIIRDNNCNLNGIIVMVIEKGLYIVKTMFGKVVVTGDNIIYNANQ